jgi:hypothetical protein
MRLPSIPTCLRIKINKNDTIRAFAEQNKTNILFRENMQRCKTLLCDAMESKALTGSP